MKKILVHAAAIGFVILFLGLGLLFGIYGFEYKDIETEVARQPLENQWLIYPALKLAFWSFDLSKNYLPRNFVARLAVAYMGCFIDGVFIYFAYKQIRKKK